MGLCFKNVFLKCTCFILVYPEPVLASHTECDASPLQSSIHTHIHTRLHLVAIGIVSPHTRMILGTGRELLNPEEIDGVVTRTCDTPPAQGKIFLKICSQHLIHKFSYLVRSKWLDIGRTVLADKITS